MSRDKQIPSTDWLTKGYSEEELASLKADAIKVAEAELRDKQIEEMAKDLIGEIKYDTVEHYYSEDSRWTDVEFDYTKIAENLIDKGYRKAPEVIEDLFEEFEALVTQKDMPITTMALLATKEYADFKKKWVN